MTIFSCMWQTEELEKEYTHKSEITPDSVLFVPELDYDYYYEDYDKVSTAEALKEEGTYDYANYGVPGIQGSC